MLNIVTIRSDSFRTDKALRQELLDLMAPSYEDPTVLLTRELEHCNSLYLARDDGRLLCFFFVAWEAVEVEECGNVPTIYLGLSAARQDAGNPGLIGWLYLRCDEDLVSWEKENKRHLLCWGTTANPIAYLAARAFRVTAEPHLDGSYSSLGAKLAWAIRRGLMLSESTDGHPFVLKGVASGTLYSRQEVEKIARVSEAKKFSLLRDLGIDEAAGDRLLFLAPTPDNKEIGSCQRF